MLQLHSFRAAAATGCKLWAWAVFWCFLFSPVEFDDTLILHVYLLPSIPISDSRCLGASSSISTQSKELISSGHYGKGKGMSYALLVALPPQGQGRLDRQLEREPSKDSRIRAKHGAKYFHIDELAKHVWSKWSSAATSVSSERRWQAWRGSKWVAPQVAIYEVMAYDSIVSPT